MNPVPSVLRRVIRGAACAAALVTLGPVASAAPAAKPNVLIFFIDDLGRADLGFDGSKFHETPRLDAWAKTGVRFTDFYSANPVCSPTRAALMTGKQPHRLGITDWIAPNTGIMLSARETTLGEAFKAKVVDATTESFIFELTGRPAKTDEFVDLMRPIGLVEVSRTGVAAISRGPDPI